MEAAEGLKAKGNQCFAAGQPEAALEAYAGALQALGTTHEEELRELRCALHSNSAACLLRLKRFGDCVEVRDDSVLIGFLPTPAHSTHSRPPHGGRRRPQPWRWIRASSRPCTGARRPMRV